ncbi:hypothetical protein [Sporosarcina sp. BP05]|uniref:hypothetical protein n=1 Tax=Sporosarcina sp. BP05 TaxID=2758726 RepID=UPI001646E82D|nr:hypothetical protein [Sporosarcina sp. BP05]
MNNLWEKYNKLIFIVIILVLFLAVMMKNSQLNKSETSLSEQDERVADLEKEIKEQEKVDEIKENTDTFDKDLTWFVTNTYESNDPYELYNKIKNSVSKEVLVQLIGEEIPTEPQPGSDVVTKKVQSVDVYGKYVGEKIYHAVVTFDYEYAYKDTVQKIQKVVMIELKDMEGDWFVTDFKEVQLGDSYAS